MRDSKTNSFRQLIIGALVGSLTTGVSQYFINIQLNAQKLSEQQVTIFKDYLKEKLKTRTQAYSQVAQKVNEAILNPTPQTKQTAIRSLYNDIPFFQPKIESQSRIMSTKRILLLIVVKRC